MNPVAAAVAACFATLAGLCVAPIIPGGPHIVPAVILLFLAVFFSRSIMIARQWEKAIVLRLGKLQAVRGPGIFLIIPFIDTVSGWVDQRIQTTEFNAEQALTRDTVPVNVD